MKNEKSEIEILGEWEFVMEDIHDVYCDCMRSSNNNKNKMDNLFRKIIELSPISKLRKEHMFVKLNEIWNTYDD